MKRILIFSLNYYPRFIGGAEVAIKEITDRVSPEEIEFHMVTLRFDSNLPKKERVGNVIVHRIGPTVKDPSIADLKKFPLHLNKHLYQILAADKALWLHLQYRFDGIWAMMAHSCGIPAAIFKIFMPKVPYLLTLQEGDPPEHIERLARPVWPLFKRGFTSADYIQPISNFLFAWGIRMGFKGYGEVIPNAVDVPKFAKVQQTADIERMKEKLGKKDDDVFMVTTSRLVHKNAVDDCIRALPLLPEHVSFLIYGIGPDEEKLRALAEELGVADRSRFMGQISHDEMPLMLRACDIFIRPSRSEGMGNSFVEAMAAGLPVIATQEGGIADFLFDEKKNPDKGTTGWAVASDSPEEIRDAVKDILARPEKVASVTNTARAMVEKTYDWDIVASSMRSLFTRMTTR
ncbi:MAG: phosphatidylinositol alpha-1,6-mannosyltransferase [Parcubacteria bacterium C7867-004]|nr:MAG: phosphatidylinositol alpha-1,6-mannosyltransferase [Parcubacteria bacterium C7867-004]